MADQGGVHGFHRLRVARVVRETADACSLVLDVPPELRDRFEYAAGQFCTFRVSIEDRALHRCYSMSSAPAVDAALTVTVKRVPGGAVSNWINDRVRPGDDLDVTAPAGTFRLAAGDGAIVAFAAGSGITPIISLAKEALATTDRSVHVLYANRDEASTIFLAELDDLVARHPDRLVVEHHVDAAQGFVDADALAAVIGRAAPFQDAYVCGPEPFMDLVDAALAPAAAADADVRVHIERFTPAEALAPDGADADGAATGGAATGEPGDGGDAAVLTITVDGRTETTTHHPGTTVLQAARQAGLTPPSSCESGSCATCMARVSEGSVTMHVNDALSDDEVAEGWILTCQSVPTSPTLTVEYGFD